jgi:hypothetical protein
MSPQQLVTLLEAVSYDELMTQTIRIHVSGTMEMRRSETYDDWYYDYDEEDYVDYVYSETTEVSMTIEANYYMLFSEMVGEAKMIITGNIDMESFNSSNWYNELNEEEVAAEGSLNAYLYNQAFYLNPSMSVTENGATTTHDFKQKLNQTLTQEMYDEMIEGLLTQIGFMTGTDPEEIGEMIDTDELDDVFAAIPNLKIYQDGNVITIVFEINKQDIIDNAIDFALAAAEVIGQETPSQAEIDEARQQIENAINEAVETFNFKYSISIVGQTITRIVIEVKALIDNEDIYLDIDMIYIMEFGIELPAFPTDLDTYVPVDDFDLFE